MVDKCSEPPPELGAKHHRNKYMHQAAQAILDTDEFNKTDQVQNLGYAFQYARNSNTPAGLHIWIAQNII